MKRVIRFTALAIAVSANVGSSYAAQHSFGTYSTRVAESRLFVGDKVTTLRCDLFFSVGENNGTLVAPKGSVVKQTVPRFVWQYSGLLPVSDYLKTVALHSVGSDKRERSWQDVQQTFYNGLRAEGASESDAKIAYAGAYAFAPRWALVQLVDITIPERDKETRLYQVKETPAVEKGVSIAEYQELARDILMDPQRVSLQDIRGVIDAADAVNQVKQEKSSFGSLFSSEDKDSKDPAEDLFIDKAARNQPVMDKPAMDIEALEEKASVVLTSTGDGVIVGIDQALLSEGSPPAVKQEAVQPTEWEQMPDGSEKLIQIGS